jgi:hypothetical protein
LEPGRPKTAAAPGAKPNGPALPAGLPSDLPVEISCRGPFRFEMSSRAATFRDQVDVMRINPNGPSDQISCDVLTIGFEPRRAKPGAPPEKPASGAANLTNLEPQRLQAEGNPVIVLARTQNAEARGQKLSYDLRTGALRMEGSEEVSLKQDINEIHAMSVKVDPGPAGRLGQIEAKGPGWLRGQMRQQPGQQMEASWKEMLRVRPQEQNQVVSLLGGAQLKFPQMGRLDAREIHFWLTEAPQSSPTQTGNRYLPDRMLAEGGVVIDSPQLCGQVGRFYVHGISDQELVFFKDGEDATSLPPVYVPPAR